MRCVVLSLWSMASAAFLFLYGLFSLSLSLSQATSLALLASNTCCEMTYSHSEMLSASGVHLSGTHTHTQKERLWLAGLSLWLQRPWPSQR